MRLWPGAAPRLRVAPRFPKARAPVTAGRGSYGRPEVYSWGEGAVLRVGNYCGIADGVKIFLGGEHRTDWVTTYAFSALWDEARGVAGHPRTKGDVVLGNDVWIAHGAVLLSGVTVGDGAVIGGHAVVASDVPAYGVVAGNPARLLRKRFPEAIIERLLRVTWWNWPEAELRAEIRRLLSTDIEAFLEYAERRDPGRHNPA